ncbi:hypothetical protein H0H92_009399 [Tricholoma furcatifolium]|nr:hypothetical protein H0H92_009399 [Tricholoma furcatifolium]
MKSATENRKPYSGLTRSLVIAIDIGTTFSGVSYAILEPGEIPKIHGVTRFPGQEHVAGNTKIPSIIYYDKHGKMMAAGAEADTSSVMAQAEDDGWTKTELFKLRLRPRTMQLNMNGMRLGPLPRRKTAIHVFGDFLAYLYRCTRNFIIDTHGNGAALWNTVENNIQFVLSHPNGWEGAQQSKMRRSAVYGGLIPDTNEGKARIRFVTEGEASLHACVLNGLAADVLTNPSKNGFLIADAGGGTLDISAYAIRGTLPLVMEEIAPPDLEELGNSLKAKKLRDSKYGTPAALDHITQRFDETTKRLFRDRNELQFIPFGSPLDKDLSVGIRGGQLKLTGNEVANLFEPSVDAAVSAIRAQIDASNGIIKSVFLVGGYAASPWLFHQLQERLAPLNVTVSRPDTQTSKAVADGAIGFYCDHHVSARMSKFMYGVEFLREMDPANPDHVARQERLCELPSGPKLLPDAFDCILNRGVKVKESTVFTRKYCTELTSLSMLSMFEVEIWCYRGGTVIPKWIDRHGDEFSTLCVVQADLSPLSGSAEPKAGKNGKTYWTIVFSVEIHFGLTEFKARIKWVDDSLIFLAPLLLTHAVSSGPASIIYNERGHRAEEDEPDGYPEDDVGTASPRNDRLRSEPASRARTPVEQFYHPSSGEIRGMSPALPVAQPLVEAPSMSRTPSLSKGYVSPSIASALHSSRDLSRSMEPEKSSQSPAKRERTPSLAPSVAAPSISSRERTPSLAPSVAASPVTAPRSRTPSLAPSVAAPSITPRERTPSLAPSVAAPPITPRERTPSLAPSLAASFTAPPDLSRGFEPEAAVTPTTPKDKGKEKEKTPVATPKIEDVAIEAPLAKTPKTTPKTTPKMEATLPPVEPTPPSAKPTPKSTLKATPKVEETLPPPVVEPTSASKSSGFMDTVSNSLWGSKPSEAITSVFGGWGSTSSAKDVPKASESSFSAASKRMSFAWGSSAEENKPSEVINPIDDAPKSSPVPPAAPTIDDIPKSVPAPETSQSPVVQDAPAEAPEPPAPAASPAAVPVTAKAKKKKKGGASAAATPAVEAIETPVTPSVEPPPAPAPATTEPEPTPAAAVEEATATSEKPSSNVLTPIGLEEVTLSTKTPEAGPLAMSDEVQDTASSLFDSNVWGSSNAAAPKSNDLFDALGSLDKDTSQSETPANEVKEAEVKEPEVPVETPTKSTFGWGAPSKATTPAEKSKAPLAWGAKTTPTKPTPLGWGASSKAATPTEKPKTTDWGTSAGTTNSTPGWGTTSSFGSAAKAPAKSPWGSKLNTPTTPSSPWGAKPSTTAEVKEKEENAKEEEEKAKAEAEVKAKEEAEAKAKEEAEAKAKEEAEAKAKAEAEVKAKEEAEAKAKEEAEAKAKEEAEAKAKEEAEAKAKEEAEAKAKEEPEAAEAKAKEQADAKAKEEEEAKTKEEAETKAKEEEEAKAKEEVTPEDAAADAVSPTAAEDDDKGDGDGGGGGGLGGGAKKKKKKKGKK